MRSIFFILVLCAIASLPLANRYLSAGSLAVFTKENIEEIVSQYIDNNPQQILDSLNNLHNTQEKKRVKDFDHMVSKNLAALEDDITSPFVGPEDAEIVIVEFFDYSCGYCKRLIDTKINIVNKYPNLKYVFKEVPMFGPSSLLAATGALAAYMVDKSKYLDFHAALMRHTGEVTEEVLMDFAKKLNIDQKQFKMSLNSEANESIIRDNLDLARRLGVHATPTLVVNGKYFAEPLVLDSIESIINKKS